MMNCEQGEAERDQLVMTPISINNPRMRASSLPFGRGDWTRFAERALNASGLHFGNKGLQNTTLSSYRCYKVVLEVHEEKHTGSLVFVKEERETGKNLVRQAKEKDDYF